MLAALLPDLLQAQVDPVQARFGGQEDDFTEKYGAPVGTANIPDHDDTSVWSYEVFGFEEVSATIYRDQVIGLTLRPVEGDTWTEEAAQTVIGDFAPSDADFDDDRVALGPDAEGVTRVGIQGASDRVEEAVDEDVYEEFESGGEPGDFAVTLFEAVPSLYSGLSIDLGIAGEADALPETIAPPSEGQAANDEPSEQAVGSREDGDSRCEVPSPELVYAISTGVEFGMGLDAARAVRSDDYQSVYFVAAYFTGAGLDQDEMLGVWAVSRIDSAATPIYAADPYSEGFSNWPFLNGEGFLSALDAAGSDGFDEAKECAEDAL